MSLRALVAAAEEAQRPRGGGVRTVLAWVTAVAGLLLTALGITAIVTGKPGPHSRLQSPVVP